jgi:proteasome activator subunit 4
MNSLLELDSNAMDTDFEARIMEDADLNSIDFSDDNDLYFDENTLERQLAITKTYTESLPYKCESPEVMQAKLEKIVGKIMVCAKSKNWTSMTAWDMVLQW